MSSDKKVDLELAIQLRQQQRLSYKEIAGQVGTTAQNIRLILRKRGEDHIRLTCYVCKQQFVATVGCKGIRDEKIVCMEPTCRKALVGKDKVSVQGGSILAKVIKIIMEDGPSDLTTLTDKLRAQGVAEGSWNFRTVVNTSLHRRKHDLFRRDKRGVFHLRTTDIRFTGSKV